MVPFKGVIGDIPVLWFLSTGLLVIFQCYDSFQGGYRGYSSIMAPFQGVIGGI